MAITKEEAIRQLQRLKDNKHGIEYVAVQSHEDYAVMSKQSAIINGISFQRLDDLKID